MNQAVVQGLALEVFQDEEHLAVLLTDIEQRADVRMLKRRDGARFLSKALAALRPIRKRRRQQLDGHGAVESRVAGAVDLSHPARANGRLDFVWTEACAGGQRHL